MSYLALVGFSKTQFLSNFIIFKNIPMICIIDSAFSF